MGRPRGEDLALGHRLVVVLAGVHEDLLRDGGERGADGGGLDDLRARADHGEHARTVLAGTCIAPGGDARGTGSSWLRRHSRWQPHAAALSVRGASASGVPPARSEASATSTTATISIPRARFERGSSPVRMSAREVFELQAQRLLRLDAGDQDVAGAVDQLVLAEVGGLGRQHVHAAVVDAHGFIGGGVVVD